MTDYLREEQRIGGYEAEAKAATQLHAARESLTRLTGLPGGIVEFVDNGTNAVSVLLESWPLQEGARIAIPRSEFASNRMALERIAGNRGLAVLELAEDPLGRVDLEQAQFIMEDVDLVVVSHVPSQRGIVQPIEELVEIAHGVGTEVLVDVCQSLGHQAPFQRSADAYAGTSRKWLYGPRGCGFAVMTRALWERLDGPPTLQTHQRGGRIPGAPAFERSEGAIVSRVGLARALVELEQIGLDTIALRLSYLGSSLREALAGLSDWHVREPREEGTPLVTLDARGQLQPAEAVRRLRASGIAAGVVSTGRALDVERPVLRLAPDPGATELDVERVRRVLRS